MRAADAVLNEMSPDEATRAPGKSVDLAEVALDLTPA